jgi:NADH:ubiquinone oxidoreductase subunit E
MSLQKILLQFEPRPENVLKVLKVIQKENKYISQEEFASVASYFSLPLARVYSLASFFDEIKTKKQRKKIIKVCSGSACFLKKTSKIIRQVELLLKIELNNDAHPKYKLELMSCRGLCDQGPILMIDEQVFEKIKPENVDDIIVNYL